MGIESTTFGILAQAMLCQLSYAARSVRVCDISELSLVPSISSLVYSSLQSGVFITQDTRLDWSVETLGRECNLLGD